MVCFQSLQERLLTIARERVRAGIFTERKLARLCGLSQPYMHNLLKGIRSPSITSADRLMQVLGLGVPDLIWQTSSELNIGIQAVPILKSRIGPGSSASFDVVQGCVPLPETLLTGLVDPVAARVGPDIVMPNPLKTHDVVLLDQNAGPRMSPDPSAIWVISDLWGLRFRYVRRDNDRLFIANQTNLETPEKWHFEDAAGSKILRTIKARVVWMSRALISSQ
jgi:transcriptional regulator with XRE-family HTH domain